MYKFGKRSKQRLESCHPELQRLLNAVMDLQVMDFTILCGHRTESEQNAILSKNTSVKWPNSRHNKTPSLAFDISPYPTNWDDIDSFKELSFLVMKCAQKLNIPIIYGGYWDKPKDYPHYQLNLCSCDKSNKNTDKIDVLEKTIESLKVENENLKEQSNIINNLINKIKSLSR